VLNNYYEIYINACTQLASTLIIKSQDTVDGLNRYVNDQAMMIGVDEVNLLQPETFKYYLNISGQYHPVDVPMYIISMDTLEVIKFTIENLILNPATAKAYQYGTRHYKVLLTQYPDQELLIKGILYPIDINKAIAATDGTILGYPLHLVEPNEYSLISNLQKWIYGYKIRWTNVQYGISDVLYPATALGIMYLNLLPAILTYRLQACKSNEAHSFHVRQYLASHNLLNDYIDHMTLSQGLFFYRNIAYIERNAGKKAVFDWLTHNIMTVRNLPLTEYTMHHDLTNLSDNIYPEIVFYRKSLNEKHDLSRQRILTLSEVLDIENKVVSDNKKHNEQNILSIEEQMENATSSIIPTKILESSVIDESNSEPYSLNEILINQWIYLASIGKYVAYVNVINPKTNSLLTLSALDAFILAWYVFCNSIGINVLTIPKAVAIRVQRILPTASTIVTADEIMTMVDSKRVDRTLAVELLSLQPKIDTLISIDAFYILCTKIHKAAQMQRKITAKQEQSIQRAMVANMVSRIYSDCICTLVPTETLYGSWLNERNIDISDMAASELSTFYTTILTAATGVAEFANSSIGNIQKAMMNIMTQLSSYSVQFISTINNGVVNRTDWTTVRADNIFTRETGDFTLLDLGTGVIYSEANHYSEYKHQINIGDMTKVSMSESMVIKHTHTERKHPILSTPITKFKIQIETIRVKKAIVVTGDSTSPNIDIYGFNENPSIKIENTVTDYIYADNEVINYPITP